MSFQRRRHGSELNEILIDYQTTKLNPRCVFVGGITGIFNSFLVLDLDVLVPLQVFATPSEVIIESESLIDGDGAGRSTHSPSERDGGGHMERAPRLKLGDLVKVVCKRLVEGYLYAPPSRPFVQEWRRLRWKAVQATRLTRLISRPPSPANSEERASQVITQVRMRPPTPPPIPIKSTDVIPKPPLLPSERDLSRAQARKKKRETRLRDTLERKTAGLNAPPPSALAGPGRQRTERGDGVRVARRCVFSDDTSASHEDCEGWEEEGEEEEEAAMLSPAFSGKWGATQTHNLATKTRDTGLRGVFGEESVQEEEEEEEVSARETFQAKYAHLNTLGAIQRENADKSVALAVSRLPGLNRMPELAPPVPCDAEGVIPSHILRIRDLPVALRELQGSRLPPDATAGLRPPDGLKWEQDR